MRKQDVVDIHCHFINFDYLPDKYTIHLLKKKVGDLAHLFDEEDFKDRQSVRHGKIVSHSGETILKVSQSCLERLRLLELFKRCQTAPVIV